MYTLDNTLKRTNSPNNFNEDRESRIILTFGVIASPISLFEWATALKNAGATDSA